MQLHHRIAHHARRLVAHVWERYDIETVGGALVILALVGVLAYQFGLNAGRRGPAAPTGGSGATTTVPAGGIDRSQFDVFITATSTGVYLLSFSAPKAAEVVRRGTTYTLKWQGIGYDGFAAGEITLSPVKGSGKPQVLNDVSAFVDLAAGVYQWKVPSNLAPGSYTVSVSVTRIFTKDDTPQEIARGRSAAFLVVE
jgi:hypothetical protein